MLSLFLKAVVLTAVIHHPGAARVTVQPGDTLSGIAVTQCHKVNDWTGIYARNRGLIGSNPNVIQPGQRLAIECKDPRNLLRLASAQQPSRHSQPSMGSGSDRWDGQHHACGDGDGDGYDMPCSQLPGYQASSTPVQAASAPQVAAGNVSTGGMGSFQACVISRESGGNPAAYNPSSGAGGLYQFLQSTWTALGFPGSPQNAPVSMQNAAFAKEYAQSGTSAWSAYDGC